MAPGEAMDVEVDVDNLEKSFDLLPKVGTLFNGLLQAIPKDPKRVNVRMGDVAAEATELREQYQTAFSVLQQLPGIELSPAQQQLALTQALETLQHKRTLVQQYRNTLFQGKLPSNEDEENKEEDNMSS